MASRIKGQKTAARKKTAPKTAAPKAKKPQKAEQAQNTDDDPARQWQDAAQAWQRQMTEQMAAARRAGAAAKPSGGQTGLPPFSQPFADVFARMGDPLMNMAAQQGATDRLDAAEIMTRWLETQRGWLELSLQQTTPPTDFNDVWKQMGAATAGASLPAFWVEMGNIGAGKVFDPFDMMSQMPGIGYNREKHEDYARLYKAWQSHEAAQRHYNSEMLKLGLSALTRFEETLKNPPTGQAPFTSLKSVYAHWVDISEDTYAKFAMSEDHAKIYGGVVNTMAALRTETNRLTDDWAQSMNLPTRTEVDSLHRSLHDLARENRSLRCMLQERGKDGRK